MDNEHAIQKHSRVRACLGALFLIGAYFGFDPLELAIHAPLAKALGLHMIAHSEMGLLPYGVLMLVRLALDLLVVAAVLAILRHSWSGFPLIGPRSMRLTLLGLAIGFLVMTGAILTIIASGSAIATMPPRTASSAIIYGTGWLAFDYLGAAGEELYGRVAVLLVAQSLIGWRGAILVSGLMFSVLHLSNPGADWIWLLRLSIQGILLAYAVYRTESVWWSIGYHTGWNWASAPLFGTAGSGFLDQGHLLDFKPVGSTWITGGTVGPEGSVYAFLAVLSAFGLLTALIPNRRRTERAAAFRREHRLPERP